MRLKLLGKRWRVGCLVAFAFFSLLVAYSLWVEPYRIETTEHRFTYPLDMPLKIAHLSDLHSYGLGRREQKVLEILEAQKPDLILITGDSIPRGGDYELAAEVLSKLRAPLGVWAVRGNHECWAEKKDEREFWEKQGVKLLINENVRVRDDVWLIGLDDAYAGAPNLEKAMQNVPEEALKIAFFHSPDYFDTASEEADLVLAGHTHGGQIRLPVYGALWLPPHSGDYDQGWFEKNGAALFVSRGVGTSVVDARLLCRPEVAIITVGQR